MALYAVDDDDLIYAGHAEAGKIYWCLDCFGPVKKRRSRHWLPHFYHLAASPQCRLYSKTEEHLLAQIQLQKLFPEGALQIERPFSPISRIADLCWESEKVVFEIQCSPIAEEEAAARMRDYRGAGYEVVWLLDDRRYNKKLGRPTEEYLRGVSTYYMTIKQGIVYDQFEVFSEGQRVKKGKRMPIDLRKIRHMPNVSFSEELFPKQIAKMRCARYFVGDRIHRALQNHWLAMQNWRGLEIQHGRAKKKISKWRRWLQRYVIKPYLSRLSRGWDGPRGLRGI